MALQALEIIRIGELGESSQSTEEIYSLFYRIRLFLVHPIPPENVKWNYTNSSDSPVLPHPNLVPFSLHIYTGCWHWNESTTPTTLLLLLPPAPCQFYSTTNNTIRFQGCCSRSSRSPTSSHHTRRLAKRCESPSSSSSATARHISHFFVSIPCYSLSSSFLSSTLSVAWDAMGKRVNGGCFGLTRRMTSSAKQTAATDKTATPAE